MLLNIIDVAGLNISGCENVIIEGTDPSFTCGTFKEEKLQWTAYDYSLQNAMSGSCSKHTCTSNTNNFNLSVGGSQSAGYTSRLTLKNITRSARQLFCNTSNARTECILNVIGK